MGQRDVWESFFILWHLVGTIVTIVAGVINFTTSTSLALVASLVAFGVWYAVLYFIPTAKMRRNPLLGLGYMGIGIVLYGILVTMNPVNYILLFVLYPPVYMRLSIQFAGFYTVLLSVISVMSSAGWSITDVDPGLAIIWLSSGAGAAFLGLFIDRTIRQSTERKSLIEKLEAAQAQLAQAERETGILQERQRMAQEIHDTLAQDFISVIMNIEAAEAALTDYSGSATKHLEQARTAAREGLTEARRLVWAMRPDLLEGVTLPQALRSLGERWSQGGDLTVEINIHGDEVALHTQHETTLLRATQEALNNVRKHAEARTVTITLSFMGDVVALDIADDGRGIANSPTNGEFSSGYGIKAMRDRVEALSGELSLDSQPGEGTTLGILLPLNVTITEERHMA